MTYAAAQASDADALKAKVEFLERQLEDAHLGDYNTLARAYRSLLQHIQTLRVEAQIMKQTIDSLDVEVANPDEVSNQLTGAGVVAAIAVVTHRLLTGSRWTPLRRVIYAGGALYLGLSFTAVTLGRVGSLLGRNRQRKGRLLRCWEELMERIRIMEATSQWDGQTPAHILPSAHAYDGAASEAWARISLRDSCSQGEGEGGATSPPADDSREDNPTSRKNGNEVAQAMSSEASSFVASAPPKPPGEKNI